jgi:hypothetical protein
MKRFLFAVAVVALSAVVGVADDKPLVTAPAPTTATVAPVYTYEQPTTQRRGLFSRFRNRNTSNYSTAPLMTAPAVPAATPMPPTTTPQPMPSTKPNGSTSAPMMKSGTVVQASGNLPPGTYTATDGTVIQVGGTTPTMSSTSTGSTRMGLFSRLRNR